MGYRINCGQGSEEPLIVKMDCYVNNVIFIFVFSNLIIDLTDKTHRTSVDRDNTPGGNTVLTMI